MSRTADRSLTVPGSSANYHLHPLASHRRYTAMTLLRFPFGTVTSVRTRRA
jgi:hypothetical protein